MKKLIKFLIATLFVTVCACVIISFIFPQNIKALIELLRFNY